MTLNRKLRRLASGFAHVLAAACVLVSSLPASTVVAAPRPVNASAPAMPAAGVVGDGTPGSCTEGALLAALAGGGSVTFDCGGPATITLTATWTVTTTTTIDGGAQITLSGGSAVRLFVVQASAALTLQNLVVEEAYILSEDGGAIENSGQLTIQNSTFRNNESDGNTWGGALANLATGTLVIDGSVFETNQATDGGALLNFGVLTVTNSTFQYNLAHNLAARAYGGGAILQESTGTTIISNTVMRGNQQLTDTGGGGAISLNGGEMVIVNSLFEDNLAEAGGGALATNFGFTATITNSRFLNNTTTQPGSDDRYGGAIYNWGPLLVYDSTFSGNSANQGGAIWTGPTTLVVLHGSTLSGNDASSRGGGLMVVSGTVSLVNSTLSGNSATQGGGIYTEIPAGTGTLDLHHVTLAENGTSNLEVAAASQPPSLQNSLLANPSSGGDCMLGAALTSGGYNLASDASCSLNGTGDLNSADPLLASLNDNGGPTFTHLPMAGSPAVDAFTGNGCVALDQRGVVRPAGAACDMGAVEIGASQSTPPLVEPVSLASTYVVRGNALYWRTPPDCGANPIRPETIARAPIQGDEPARVIYQNNAACATLAAAGPAAAGAASHLIQSNLVADDSYLYWTTDQGLQRLGTQAVPGTPPQVLAASVTGAQQLAHNTLSVVALDNAQHLNRILKLTGQVNAVPTGGAISSPKTSSAFGQEYQYWLQGSALRRYNPVNGQTVTLATGVVAYLPIGGQQRCRYGLFDWSCTNYDIVLYSLGGAVWDYDNLTGHSSQIYTSSRLIYDLAHAGGYLFTLEEESVSCSIPGLNWPCKRSLVGRVPVSYNGHFNQRPNAYLYYGPATFGRSATNLQAASGHVFWQESLAVKKLPYDADALPNVEVTDLEVTQGIQRPDGTIPLIRYRQTYVRVFARTTTGRPLAGVDARLLVYGNTTLLGTLKPKLYSIRFTGDLGSPFAMDYSITVQPNPQRDNLTQQFVFEIPLEWTSANVNLNFVAEVNPGRAPYEASWDDNVRRKFVSLGASPPLSVQFAFWRYRLPGQAANTPDIAPSLQDRDSIYSYLRRTYPIASRTDLPNVGLRPSFWWISDSQMGQAVARDPAFCFTLPLTTTDGVYHPEACAATHSNQQLSALRSRAILVAGVFPVGQPVVSNPLFMYGVISDTGVAGQVPRGVAASSGREATGPVGVPRSTMGAWDTDSNYGDWIAAHEIGHSLGLPHPATGNTSDDGCQPYDVASSVGNSVPNEFARIGANENTQGFDFGDRALNIPLRTYRGTAWHDFMSYCDFQWISDWTYRELYQTLLNAAANAPAALMPVPAAPGLMQAGPWLLVQGGLSGADSGLFSNVERLPAAAAVPPLVPGGYALELRSSGGGLLASYPFTPLSGEDSPGVLAFTQLITDVAGSASVRLVRLSDSALLAERALSPHAPTLNNISVNLVPDGSGALLGWSAGDIDGDPLTFDVLYSLDGGQAFMPVAFGLTGSQAELDTAWLAGGSALFQVIASDGSNTTVANSSTFTMPFKAPEVQIIEPGSGQVVQVGQAVNLLGHALDPQTGAVGADGLSWHSISGTLGVGAALTLWGLPLGTHTITFTAVNSYSVAASTSVTFTVADNLALLGPTLAANPVEFVFHFDTGATQVQTATLFVSNAGSGQLDWAVASAPAWLTAVPLTGTLPISGTEPGALLLTADPALLANSSVTDTVLVLEAMPADDATVQTVTIRLLAAKGIFLGGLDPNQADIRRVFVPIIIR